VALRILVPYDGSAGSKAALAVARLLADQLGHRIHLLHVTDTPSAEAQVRRRLHIGQLRAKNLVFSVRVGEPSEEIALEGGAEDVALIVMATHGGTASEEHPLAPITHATTLKSPCPMVLVTPELLGRPEIPPMRKLLLPLDGSPTTARALRTATQLAEDLGASIDLLYVAGPGQAAHEPGGMTVPRYVDQPHHEWPHWGEEVVDRLLRGLARCPDTVPVDIFLTDGEPGPEIAQFAARHEEDGIVLVRRSQLEPGRGKILRHLLAQTPIPVIFVIAQHPRYVFPSVQAS